MLYKIHQTLNYKDEPSLIYDLPNGGEQDED